MDPSSKLDDVTLTPDDKNKNESKVKKAVNSLENRTSENNQTNKNPNEEKNITNFNEMYSLLKGLLTDKEDRIINKIENLEKNNENDKKELNKKIDNNYKELNKKLELTKKEMTEIAEKEIRKVVKELNLIPNNNQVNQNTPQQPDQPTVVNKETGARPKVITSNNPETDKEELRRYR